MGLASVSVDVDSLRHYCRIHGLPEALLHNGGSDPIYAAAVGRFCDLFHEVGLAATFFVIGEDLAQPEAHQSIAAVHRLGHELGNHSFRHDYALTRCSPERLEQEVAQAGEAIARICGAPPAGFRAPGYTLSAGLYRTLEQLGYQYDSSVFPSVPYYAAKAAVMGAMTLTGRKSRALLDSPQVLRAPLTPYRPDPDQPYAPGDGCVWELPISCAPYTRLPFIGTFVAAMPRLVVRAAYRSLRRQPFLNFELHAIDLLDEEDGVPRELLPRQPDLSIPRSTKRARIREALQWIREDFETVTLAQAAALTGR